MNEYITIEEYLQREEIELEYLMDEITFDQIHEALREMESIPGWNQAQLDLLIETEVRQRGTDLDDCGVSQSDERLGRYIREICAMYWRFLAKERADDWVARETDRRAEEDRLRGIA